MSALSPSPHRELLDQSSAHRIYRSGRFLVAELLVEHAVISTSVCNGGYSERLRFLVNHQSCEAVSHSERHGMLHKPGLDHYHELACGQAGLEPQSVALMGTAANMNYASIVHARSAGISATAVVTAGVGGNAACAADPTRWAEGPDGFEKVSPYGGTINTILLIDRALKPGAIMAAAIVMAEAKAAALQQLAVRSRYSRDFATGTTTDQFCIACPLGSLPELSSASSGVRLGELIGRAVRDATLEALRWQNGLEASYARNIFHALGRFGLSEESFLADMAARLDPAQAQLLKANRKAVVYEPLVAASAFAIAAVLDRVRHGILPPGAAKESLRHQGASMAAGLAAQPDRWMDFYRALAPVDLERPADLVLDALGRGWAAKWN